VENYFDLRIKDNQVEKITNIRLGHSDMIGFS